MIVTPRYIYITAPNRDELVVGVIKKSFQTAVAKVLMNLPKRNPLCQWSKPVLPGPLFFGLTPENTAGEKTTEVLWKPVLENGSRGTGTVKGS
jgi:hypothetical protein